MCAQSQLPKFVQINWCGDGVPVFKKGLFHTHSSAVANFLKSTHVVISARNQADVSPSVIMSRVEAASGSKYSIHKESARKFEPIGPVGTNYTPVGKVDINALRREAAAKPPAPPQPTMSRPPGVGQQWSKPTTFGSQSKYTPPPPVKPTPAPDDDWEPAPAPVKSTPAPPLPSAVRPTPPSPAVSMSFFIRISGFTLTPPQPVREEPKPAITSSKPAEDDRIGPVGTNWQPVQLPKPRKLVNPFEKRAQEAQQEQQQPKPPVKKTGMTWSERQALAKKQAEEEESRSRASSFKPTPAAASTPKWKAPTAVGLGVGAGVAAGVGVSAFASRDEEPEEEADWDAVGSSGCFCPELILTSLASPPPQLLPHRLRWRLAHHRHLSLSLSPNRNLNRNLKWHLLQCALSVTFTSCYSLQQ